MTTLTYTGTEKKPAPPAVRLLGRVQLLEPGATFDVPDAAAARLLAENPDLARS